MKVCHLISYLEEYDQTAEVLVDGRAIAGTRLQEDGSVSLVLEGEVETEE